MNFAKGILESRRQHYRALKSVLKAIPLNTPTDVEVGLEHFIRVTLLDANHCVGAVMFLIEGEKRAILYTGDIRSETWWVNSLARNPIILPYTSGIQRLDNVYLDTTFATKDERYRRFQSKAAGIKELLEKVLKYPKETIFHFHAWTFGYEDVWIALSNALKSRVHVDDYKRLLYGSLASDDLNQFQCHEGPALFGYKSGNHFQKGCLTDDSSVRLHSCEHGTGCPASSSSRTVYIIPITSRDENGEILPEMGAGGGGGDLLQNHGYLELDDRSSSDTLIELCTKKVEDITNRSKIRDTLKKALRARDQVLSLDNVALWDLEGDIKMDKLVESLVKDATSHLNGTDVISRNAVDSVNAQRGRGSCRIQFPYSRHSSYEELCELVATLRPCDIYPCTTDWQEWSWDKSVENLFGHLSDMIFAHDQEMVGLESQRATLQGVKRPHSPLEFLRMTSSQPKEMRSFFASARGSEEISARECQGLPGSLDIDSLACPKRRIDELRHSFERPLKAVKARSGLHVSISYLDSVASPTNSQTTTSLGSKIKPTNENLQEPILCRSFSAGEHDAGNQAKAIELSDDASSRGDSQSQGDFLMKDLPEPEYLDIPKIAPQSSEETQVTLSDATFESQLLHVSPEEHEMQVRHRKHAYKAARDLNGAWAEDHGLLSSGADHGDEELEL